MKSISEKLKFYKSIYPKSIKLIKKGTAGLDRSYQKKIIINAIEKYQREISVKYHNDKDFYKTLKGDSDIVGKKSKRSKRSKKPKK